METLIQHYGRTCRRYRFQVVYPVAADLVAGRMEMGAQVAGAALYFENEWASAVALACSLGFDKEMR